jgi:hypothetical protein
MFSRNSLINSVHVVKSMNSGSKPFSCAIRRSLSCPTSHAYESRRPQAASCSCLLLQIFRVQQSRSSRNIGSGLMNIRVRCQIRCSFGSSVMTISRPRSRCRCRGLAQLGRPASHRYDRISSRRDVRNSVVWYISRSSLTLARVFLWRIVAGRV